MLNRRPIGKLAAALAGALLIAGCGTGTHLRTVTLTFIRHAESTANASETIDTTVPGPSLTTAGEKQAQDIARQIGGNGYDGIYASTMVRTQQTAAPLSKRLGRQIEILPGLREIGAGWYEGDPQDRGMAYFVAPMAWVRGDRTSTIPGSVDGNEFNDRFSAAVRTIYVRGDAKPVAFAHGASIAIWTLMNVRNPDDDLLRGHPLPNVGRVVIRGNPVTGWTLVDWDGVRKA